ncbi:MAG: hypothetical protein Q7U82_07815 [Gammaproteobacteria bacterium]|nr:hypothetical protein [Gammaproteobacteria bacterium]
MTALHGRNRLLTPSLLHCSLLALTLACASNGSLLAQQDSPPLQNGADTQRSIDHANSLAEYQQTIDQLQSEFGPYDKRLIEPLAGMSQVLIEAGDHDAALPLLDQQLQIHRIGNGLYTTEQIPVIQTLLRLHSAAGQWDNVTDTVQYLSWVYERDETLPPPEQLKGLKQLGDWHMRALGHDSRDREAFHLTQLSKMEERATAIAERHYGADSVELAPYLYDEALAAAYIGLAIMMTSETSQDLMQLTEGIRNRPVSGNAVPIARGLSRIEIENEIEAQYGSRASTVIERSFKNNMATSLQKLTRIRELYAANGNLEAEGLALIAIGDATLMRQQYENKPGHFASARRGSNAPGPALEYYREALALFEEAGVAPELLEALTRCPVLLPVTAFHETLEEAKPDCRHQAEPPIYDLGEYDVMATLMPGLDESSQPSEGQMEAVLLFAVRTNGQVSSAKITQIEPDNTANRVRARKLTEIMQFRPTLVSGISSRTENVQLRVRMPAAQQ